VKEDRRGLATLLIEKGADVNARDRNSVTPLHLASGNFTAKDAGDLVRFLLEHGADVNARDKDGRFPLHWAMTNYLPLTCKILLDAGADPNVRAGGGGITPLEQAIALPDSNPVREQLLDLFRQYAPEQVMEVWCRRPQP
jgi:ankyrin repeat protein